MVLARTKQYLEKSDRMKVEVEELEPLCGPEDSEVDFDESWKKRGTNKVARSLRPSVQRSE